MLTDTRLLGSLLGFDRDRLARDPALTGPLLETFVTAELRKEAGWSERAVGLWPYRRHEGQEVDLVLEDRVGRLVGIEAKASSSPRPTDCNGLRALRRRTLTRSSEGSCCTVAPLRSRSANACIRCRSHGSGA